MSPASRKQGMVIHSLLPHDRVITDPRDPLGTINEAASMISLKPYTPRF